MIYRVPESWIAQRRRAARYIAPLVTLMALGILALVLLPRVDWSKSQDRSAALFITAVVAIGFGLGGLAGRVSFRNAMVRWQSFEVELHDNELVRRMHGQEVRIQRVNVTSIREFRNRGFVVTDQLGWRIFVPKMVENYEDFKRSILTWTQVQS